MPAPRATDRRAGVRDRLLTFYSVSVATQDATGAPEEAETEVCQQWCSLKTVSGGESWIPPQISGQVTHAIICDYFSGLTSKHRIGLGTRRFDVIRVNNIDERNWQYEILANESV